jgi:hypothetical protein
MSIYKPALKRKSGKFALEKKRLLLKDVLCTANIFAVMFFVFICVCSAMACPYCSSSGNCVYDQWKYLPYGKVKVAGEIGRRIDLTVNNHLKKPDLESLFLTPFRTKESKDGFIGIGSGMLASSKTNCLLIEKRSLT